MSLRSFLEEMEKKDQPFQVDDEVSPRFEVSAFIKELDGGPILYFDNVKGNSTKIVAGVCGTRERLLTTKVGVDATRPLTKPREKFELAIIPVAKRINESITRLKKRVERKQS